MTKTITQTSIAAKPSGFFYAQDLPATTSSRQTLRNVMANIQHAVEAGSTTMQAKIAYTAGVSGLGISALTINNVVGISVGIVSIITMIWAAYSNHRKNKLHMELLRKQIGDKKDTDTDNEL